MTKQDIERMSTGYCKGFCNPSPTTPQYDVLDLDEAFCQGGERVRDVMIQEVTQRLRELNLKQYVVLLMESHKLVFTDEFYKDFENVLKGGRQ